MDKKDLKVEIMRIIACFAVIMYHTRTMPLRIDGTVSETCVFIECICSICVASFFLISGFYIYNKNGYWLNDWISLIANFIKNVLLPVSIFGIIFIIFDDYIFGRCEIVDCIKNANLLNAIKILFDGFFYFNEKYWPTSFAHMWYILEYLKIIICYPIARLLIKKNKNLLNTLVALLILYQFFVDINIFNGEWVWNKFYAIVPRPVIYSLIGYILYNDILSVIRNAKNKKDIIINKKMFVFGLVVYVLSFIGLFIIQYFYLRDKNSIHTFTSWYSIGAVTLSAALEIVIYDINFEKILSNKLKNILKFISATTLGIFIIHLPIVLKTMTTGVYGYFNKGIDAPLISKFLFLILFNLFIFIISFVIIAVIKNIKYNIFLLIKKKGVDYAKEK